MSVTTLWSPNQSAVAQVRTYTFSAPTSIGNTYVATLNSKSITYRSVSGDTAATAATALLALLQATTIPEFREVIFTSTSDGALTATAAVAGVPFANVSGTTAGLVLATGNGLLNGITTTDTQANQSPSDINDAQNWLRVNTAVTPPSRTRQLPQNGDYTVVSRSAVPMLWNLDQLATTQFASYQRWQSMTGQIGLPSTNPLGYQEWRATRFKFVGPQGSVPAGGLTLLCGYEDNSGDRGPSLERYDVGSQLTTLVALSGGTIDFVGVHTGNTFTALGRVSINIAADPGEVANLTTSTVDGGATINIGAGVTWTAASTLTFLGGGGTVNSAPATLTMSNGAQVNIATDQLTWPSITMQGGCRLSLFAGGTITTITMTQGCVLDKSGDLRPLTITNSTIDGDTCQFVDPLNTITYTNATSVRQQVTSGPFIFTGTRTVKVV